jgi:hypothetical protein
MCLLLARCFLLRFCFFFCFFSVLLFRCVLCTNAQCVSSCGTAPATSPSYTAKFPVATAHSGWKEGASADIGVAWFGDLTAQRVSANTVQQDNEQGLDFSPSMGDLAVGTEFPTSGINMGSGGSTGGWSLSYWFSFGPLASQTPESYPCFALIAASSANNLYFGPYIWSYLPSNRYLLAYYNGYSRAAQVSNWVIGQWYHVGLTMDNSGNTENLSKRR